MNLLAVAGIGWTELPGLVVFLLIIIGIAFLVRWLLRQRRTKI